MKESYAHIKDVASDIRLVWSNCMLYNEVLYFHNN